jgi:pimeloyl-ACP methyl ester carboxylesterase
MEQEPSAPRRTQRLVTEDGLELEVADSGLGPPILLLHGFPDSLAMWDGVTGHLVTAGHRVIAYSQRGYGASSAPAERRYYAFDRIVQDAVEVLGALGIREPVTVGGHDWGAFVGWGLCLSRPELVGRHIAISYGHPSAMQKVGIEQMRKNFYVPLFMLAGIGEWVLSRRDFAVLRRMGRQHPAIDDAVADLRRPGRLTAALNWYRANTLLVARHRWGVCRVPTMGVAAADDAFFTEAQMTRSERFMEADWEYVRFDGAGHYVPIEQPERVAALIAGWARG